MFWALPLIIFIIVLIIATKINHRIELNRYKLHITDTFLKVYFYNVTWYSAVQLLDLGERKKLNFFLENISSKTSIYG